MKTSSVAKILLVIFTSFLVFGCAKPVAQKKVTLKQPAFTQKSLISAINSGNLQSVTKQLSNGVDVNSVDAQGNSLLHLAVINSNGPLLSLLIEKNANINALDSQKMTPLHLAVKNNSLTLVNTLLAAKASSDIANDLGDMPIHTAIINNNKAIIEALIKNQYKDIELKNKNGLTSLMLATTLQNDDLVKLFIDNKANVNEKSNAGLSALQYAVQYSSLVITKTLVKNGASLKQLTDENKTLLHLSAEAGSLKSAKYLVTQGLKPQLKDKKGHYAVVYAIKNNHYEMVVFLIKTYSKFNDSEKFAALKYSVDKDNIKILLALHAGGISLSTVDPKTKSTILHYAVTLDNKEEILKVILKNSTHIEHRNAKGITAIAYAIKHKKDSYEKILRPYYLDARLNYIQGNYNFPALKALYLQYPEIIKQIKNKEHKISLDGPTELMIGDLKILNDKNRHQSIIVSQIKRLKSPYSKFTSNEIETLIGMGLKSSIISAIIDTTNNLEKEDAAKIELELQKKFQASILDATNRATKAQESVSVIQKENEKLTKKMIANQKIVIQNQLATIEALKTLNTSADTVADDLTKAVVQEGAKQLMKNLF